MARRRGVTAGAPRRAAVDAARARVACPVPRAVDAAGRDRRAPAPGRGRARAGRDDAHRVPDAGGALGRRRRHHALAPQARRAVRRGPRPARRAPAPPPRRAPCGAAPNACLCGGSGAPRSGLCARRGQTRSRLARRAAAPAHIMQTSRGGRCSASGARPPPRASNKVGLLSSSVRAVGGCCSCCGARAAGREQADSGTEAALAAGSPGSTDDAAVGILERLGFPRARHRTQVCPAVAGRRRRELGVLMQSAALWPACLHVLGGFAACLYAPWPACLYAPRGLADFGALRHVS